MEYQRRNLIVGLLSVLALCVGNVLALLSLTTPLLHKQSHHFATTTTLEALAWGGDYSQEVEVAVESVKTAVRLCQQVQEELAVARGDNSLGTGVSSSVGEGGSADVKVDGTPVTVADFAIQGFVSQILSTEFPEDRFMGEEDGTDLREDPLLLDNCLDLARRLLDDRDLSAETFLAAVDRGVVPAPDDAEQFERVWILDPIDGTKGLVTGKQYIVGLALTVGGRAQVAVMGNPGGTKPEVMVAVKGCGLRYWDAAADGEVCVELPRDIPNNWHMKRYDFTKLVPQGNDDTFGWGTQYDNPKAGIDYPPYLLSRPMSVGSPLPFGPLCAPSEVCCGAQIKYYAVARGEVAGFIQFQTKLKSWDHAPGCLCVSESGGIATDAAGNEVMFADREFEVSKGIVCVSAEANEMTKQRLVACVQETDITATSAKR